MLEQKLSKMTKDQLQIFQSNQIALEDNQVTLVAKENQILSEVVD